MKQNTRPLPQPLTEEERKAKYIRPTKQIWYPHLQQQEQQPQQQQAAERQ